MTHVSRLKFPAIVVMAITLLVVSAAAITAHESRDAGDLNYIVGWAEEPAYEGFPNAVSVRISGPMKTTAGALFDGGALQPGEEYSYTFGPELEGSTVPYHNHLSPELGGTVMVLETAPEGGVEIDITATGFTPANVIIHPGSSVTWHNVADTVQAVHSGKGQVPEMESDQGDDMATGATTADEDDAHASAAPTGPVEGLEGSLQVEVTHVPTGSTRTMPLLAAFNNPGHYVARLIPTAPGAYTFRVTGEIDKKLIDELFESGPGTFDGVQTQAEIQFPLQVSAPREIEGAARGAQDAAAIAGDAADAAAADAASAQTLAIIAMAIGLAGAAIGTGGVVMAFRRK